MNIDYRFILILKVIILYIVITVYFWLLVSRIDIYFLVDFIFWFIIVLCKSGEIETFESNKVDIVAVVLFSK